MKDQNANTFPWHAFSEWVGTALLVFLSLVILMFGTGGPIIKIVPSEGLRRLITGFLFGTTGTLIELSPLGKESGAHINRVVTLGFWLMHKLDARTALGYVVAQLAGASAGALLLVAGVRCNFWRSASKWQSCTISTPIPVSCFTSNRCRSERVRRLNQKR
jgi:aquaporin Z